MEKLEGKVAFITGGSSGIGQAIAEAFLKKGMTVAIAGRNRDRLDNAVSKLSHFGTVTPLELDVRDRTAMERTADKLEKDFGKVHIVCNNGGVPGRGSLENISCQEYQDVMEINLNGVLHGVQIFLPRIRSHGEGGHIVNTASMAGFIPIPGTGPYCISKAAVSILTELLYKELSEDNIGVSLFLPWIVDTPIFYQDLDPCDQFAIVQRRQALRKSFGSSLRDPQTAGEMVVKGISNNELYIFNDPVVRKMVRTHLADVYAAMDRQFHGGILSRLYRSSPAEWVDALRNWTSR